MYAELIFWQVTTPVIVPALSIFGTFLNTFFNFCSASSSFFCASAASSGVNAFFSSACAHTNVLYEKAMHAIANMPAIKYFFIMPLLLNLYNLPSFPSFARRG
jgi:hypothetical protein